MHSCSFFLGRESERRIVTVGQGFSPDIRPFQLTGALAPEVRPLQTLPDDSNLLAAFTLAGELAQ